MNEAKLIKLQTNKLVDGMNQLGFAATYSDDKRVESIMAFLQLLQKWNKTYNLTAIDQLDQMITHHALDTLAVLIYFKGKRVIDVGTGGGIPGFIIAIMHPEKHVVMLDAVGKKARFMRQVKRELKLENTEIVHARVENYMPDEKFDVVTSRAFAQMSQFLSLTQHLGQGHCKYLAMKGPKVEPVNTTAAFKQTGCWDIKVPFLDVGRKLYQYESVEQSDG